MTVDQAVQSVLKWTGYLAVFPFYNAKSGRFKTNKKYSSFIMALLTCVLIHSIVGKQNAGLFNDNEDLVFRLMSPLIQAATNVLFVFSMTSCNLSNSQILFNRFYLFDHILSKELKLRIPKLRHVYCHLALLHIYLLMMALFDVVLAFLDEQFSMLQYYISDVLHYYFICVVVFMQYYLLRSLHVRFVVLNKVIGRNNHDCIDQSLRLHGLLGDIVDAFNGLFGWHILQTMLQTVFKFLMMFGLTFGKENTRSQDAANIVIWGFYTIAQGVIVATKCEQVTNEGKKTITIAYKALHRYSNNDVLRDKLFILAQQATARCPKFTAAGFFNVDFSMLFTFVNLITTYVIVIIQFSANSKDEHQL